MFRRCLTVIVIVAVCASPAQGQFVVIDPGNLAQAVLIAERTLRHYDELRRQYETILRMGQGLGNMEGYRIPGIAITSHDAMGTTTLVRFIGIEGRVDPSIHNVGASLASGCSDLVAAERVAGVDAVADDVTRLDRRGVERLERFVDESGLSV